MGGAVGREPSKEQSAAFAPTSGQVSIKNRSSLLSCRNQESAPGALEQASECVDCRIQNLEPLGRRGGPREKPRTVASRRDNPHRATATAFQVDTAGVARYPHRGPWHETKKRKGSRACTISAG
jgi:hypothetical protein